MSGHGRRLLTGFAYVQARAQEKALDKERELVRRKFLLGALGASPGIEVPDRLAVPTPGGRGSRQSVVMRQAAIFVGMTGNETNTGKTTDPLSSFKAAQEAVRKLKPKTGGSVTV